VKAKWSLVSASNQFTKRLCKIDARIRNRFQGKNVTLFFQPVWQQGKNPDCTLTRELYERRGGSAWCKRGERCDAGPWNMGGKLQFEINGSTQRWTYILPLIKLRPEGNFARYNICLLSCQRNARWLSGVFGISGNGLDKPTTDELRIAFLGVNAWRKVQVSVWRKYFL